MANSLMKKLKLIFILIGLAYFLFPTDLIPDVAGLLGFIDDLAVFGILIYQYHLKIKKYQEKFKNLKNEYQQGNKNIKSSRSAYEVLGITPKTPLSAVKKEYKKLMSKYHPDLVNHLGPELKEFAEEKSKEIQAAYQNILDEKNNTNQ